MQIGLCRDEEAISSPTAGSLKWFGPTQWQRTQRVHTQGIINSSLVSGLELHLLKECWEEESESGGGGTGDWTSREFLFLNLSKCYKWFVLKLCFLVGVHRYDIKSGYRPWYRQHSWIRDRKYYQIHGLMQFFFSSVTAHPTSLVSSTLTVKQHRASQGVGCVEIFLACHTN